MKKALFIRIGLMVGIFTLGAVVNSFYGPDPAPADCFQVVPAGTFQAVNMTPGGEK